MSNMNSNQGIKSIVWEAVVTRADGTVENLGEIAYWHKNPFKRAFKKIKRLI